MAGMTATPIHPPPCDPFTTWPARLDVVIADDAGNVLGRGQMDTKTGMVFWAEPEADEPIAVEARP